MVLTEGRSKQLKRTAFLYNGITSVFWSLINLTPIAIYGFQFTNPQMIYWVLGLTLFVYALPNYFFNYIQLSKNPNFYRNLGIKTIRKYAQEGDLVNRFIRIKYPNYKVIKSGKSVKNYIAQTYHFERFHFQLFIIFLVITIYAVIQDYYKWALLITVNNIIFNVYPNLLQQYTRLKLRKISG